MKNVGHLCQTLAAPAALRAGLETIGQSEHFPPQSALFHVGDENVGVYLISSGTVCLEVPGVARLKRLFTSGSVLGLPSTFSEKPYSLNAVSTTDCDIIHVSKKKFLDLMRAQPELCREATEILTAEIGFIYSALREQSRSLEAAEAVASSERHVREKAVS